jgi:uncharacterized protein with HEPN domain
MTYIDLPFQQMKAMRNFLVHTYHKIDKKILRATIQDSIPELEEKIQQLLNLS